MMMLVMYDVDEVVYFGDCVVMMVLCLGCIVCIVNVVLLCLCWCDLLEFVCLCDIVFVDFDDGELLGDDVLGGICIDVVCLYWIGEWRFVW